LKLDLDKLYRLHMNDIYRYLLKLTRDKGIAEDLTQETYTRAFQFLSSALLC
jgi:RNA polymerase sigma-70 factor, ECF subfamily